MKKLNKQQITAITSQANKTLVVAGAGTGKTRVISSRIAFLLNGKYEQDEIIAFTFTNKAAAEMLERVNNEVGFITKVSISTFHSFC